MTDLNDKLFILREKLIKKIRRITWNCAFRNGGPPKCMILDKCPYKGKSIMYSPSETKREFRWECGLYPSNGEYIETTNIDDSGMIING